MDRRRFLTTSLLAGLGVAASTGAANAFQLSECGASSGDAACRRLSEHEDFLKQLETRLAQAGMAEGERRAVLAAASCPVCGVPLASSGGAF